MLDATEHEILGVSSDNHPWDNQEDFQLTRRKCISHAGLPSESQTSMACVPLFFIHIFFRSTTHGEMTGHRQCTRCCGPVNTMGSKANVDLIFVEFMVCFRREALIT